MTPDQLRASLRDPEPELRRRAVEALEESGLPDVSELVLVALGDEDWRVRKEAVRVATVLALSLSLVQDLIAAITQGDNVGLRNAALEVLAALGSDVVDKLLAALERVSDQSRKFVVEALGRTREPRVVEALTRAAASGDANVAAAAVDAMATVGGPAAETALRERLSAEDPYQRMAALDALDRLQAVVPWSELEPLLSDRLVRRVALRVLGRVDDAKAVEPLLAALAEPSRHVVAGTVLALSQLSEAVPEAADELRAGIAHVGDDALSRLRTLLAEGDVDTRRAAAHVLLTARDRASLSGVVRMAAEDELPRAAAHALAGWGADAIEPLLNSHHALRDHASGVALELASDLAAAARERGVPESDYDPASLRRALRAGLRDPHPAVAIAAARCLEFWAEAQDAASLVGTAHHKDESLSYACGRTLSVLAEREPDVVRAALADAALEGLPGAALLPVVTQLGGEGTLERVQTALSSDEPETRRRAVESLPAAAGEAPTEAIALALADESLDVQMAAARVLGELRDSDGRPVGADHLLLALASESAAVKAAAARALGATGDGRAVEALRELLREREPGVAVAAMEGLRALHDPTLGDLLVEALGHQDEEVVKQALMALREAEGGRNAHRLTLGLSHASWDVRRMAASLLGEVGGEEAVEALRAQRTGEEDDMVRAAIDEALTTLGEVAD